MKPILITGASGLVGSDLGIALHKRGYNQIIALERKAGPTAFPAIFELGDVRDCEFLESVIKKHRIGIVYHLAALLSAQGEKDPDLAWGVNVDGLRNVLKLAVKYGFQVFWPSSIAAFGPSTPKENVPQNTILEPNTIYGAGKVTGELLCQYYFSKYGVDVRSLRFPGLLGYKAPPGDGTTEYAIHMFYGAVQHNRYVSYINRGSVLPMMYIDDAIRGAIDLMEAPKERVTVRTSYNFSAFHFAPEDLVKEIQKIHRNFQCEYRPDSRQFIADTWPRSIDDSQARMDWGWSHSYDLKKMTLAMHEGIKNKLYV